MLKRRNPANPDLNPEWWIMEGTELVPTDKAPDWLKAEYENYLKEYEEYDKYHEQCQEFDMFPPSNPIYDRMSMKQAREYVDEKWRLKGWEPIDWDEVDKESEKNK